MNPTWTQTLTGLTGLRLAIYDDLLRFGRLQYDTLTRDVPSGNPAVALTSLQTAYAWLERYRLVKRGEAEGDWRPVPIAQAAEIYQVHGPITPCTGAAPSLPAQEGRGDRRSQGGSAHADRGAGATSSPRRPVQAHQAEIFALEGYRG